jgi:hypothetical protein
MPPSAASDGEHGLAVLGLGSAIDLAWPLARAVYADPGLRPPTLDEQHARVLVGEPTGEGSAAELRDLADTRAAIRGDDAASRRLLESIALSLHVKGVVVVQAASTAGERPVARVFVTTLRGFDAVVYESEPGAPVTWGNGKSPVSWAGAVQALHRGFGDAPAVVAAPPPATPEVSVVTVRPVVAAASLNHDADNAGTSHKAFYQSPWFWAAAGAAVFAAGAIYFATRNDGSDNIQVQVQVPR